MYSIQQSHVHSRVCGDFSLQFCDPISHLLQAIFVPADDLTDPAPATTFAHLDATTVLSRAISELGIYPAVDPLDSTSRIMDPNIVGNEHYEVARGVQKILQVSPSDTLHIHTLIVHQKVHLWSSDDLPD